MDPSARETKGSFGTLLQLPQIAQRGAPNLFVQACTSTHIGLTSFYSQKKKKQDRAILYATVFAAIEKFCTDGLDVNGIDIE